MPRVIGIGAALLDVLAHVPEQFLDGVSGQKGGMELVDAAGMAALLGAVPGDALRAPGGSAANTIGALARLGTQARLLAKVGDDEPGKFYRGHLAALGVDCTALKTDLERATGTCISLITPDSERTMRTFLGASSSLAPEEIAPRDFRACTHVHIEGYMAMNPPLFRRLVDTAASCNCTVCLDLASPEVVRACRDGLEYALETAVGIVFANEEEAAVYADGADPEAALARLAAHCDTAVVKLGGRGAMVSMGGRMQRFPAERVTAVDTTGAGDLWAAGFLHGVVNGWELTDTCTLAAALGAAVVQQTGASLDEATWQGLRRRFNL